MNKPLVDLAERGVVEAEAIHAARPEVLDEDVRSTDQPPQNVDAGRLMEIEPQAALVPIDRQEIRRDPLATGVALIGTDPRRPVAARRIAFRWLDLDDVCAQVRQNHGA